VSSNKGWFGWRRSAPLLLMVVLLTLVVTTSLMIGCRKGDDPNVTPNGNGGQTGGAGQGDGVGLTWLGHATFLITTPGGIRILTDPYPGNLGYGNRRFAADIVTVSHEHWDHNSVASVDGDPDILRGLNADGGWASVTATVGDAIVSSIPGTCHDSSGGARRGRNALFMIETGGLRLLHAGDLGETPSAEVLAAIGRVDVLLIPVGGVFTVDGPTAAEVARILGAKIIIPMHYRTQGIADWQISDEKPFLEGQDGVKRVGQSQVTVWAADLPSRPEIWVLDPAPAAGGS